MDNKQSTGIGLLAGIGLESMNYWGPQALPGISRHIISYLGIALMLFAIAGYLFPVINKPLWKKKPPSPDALFKKKALLFYPKRTLWQRIVRKWKMLENPELPEDRYPTGRK